jgi:hypothetical protein
MGQTVSCQVGPLASFVGNPMDRLVTIAWRAFWVALGASAVLVAQTLAAAPESAPSPAPTVQEAAPPPSFLLRGES